MMQEYKAVFEPLLLEECGAQVLRGIEEGVVMSPHPAVVSHFERVSGPAPGGRIAASIPPGSGPESGLARSRGGSRHSAHSAQAARRRCLGASSSAPWPLRAYLLPPA